MKCRGKHEPQGSVSPYFLSGYLSDKIRPNCGSGRHVIFQHGNYETETSKVAVETFQTAELSLKRRTVVFTAARGLPELATTLEELNCFHLEHWRGSKLGQAFSDHSKGEHRNC